MPTPMLQYSASQMLQSLAHIINKIATITRMPHFYRDYTQHTEGTPIDPKNAANQTIIHSTVKVSYSKKFIHENIHIIHRANAEGIQEVPFTFNLDVLKQRYSLEQTILGLRFGPSHQIEANQQMSAHFKSLVYTAMLELQALAHGKIKFYEAQTVTTGPVVFIENCGRPTTQIDGYHAPIQFRDHFAYRSWICLRDWNNDPHTLRTILHELMHALGVKELREHPEASQIANQPSGGFSSVMFYDMDRRNSRKLNKINFPYDRYAAFLGDIDKDLLTAIANGQSSPDPHRLVTFGLMGDFLRQYALALCSTSVYGFVSQFQDKNTAQLIANSCTIMLLYYLNSATESIILQVLVTLIQATCNLLAPHLGPQHAAWLEFLMLPISLLSLSNQMKLLYTENTIELVVRWLTLGIATVSGEGLGYGAAYVVKSYLPAFKNQKSSSISTIKSLHQTHHNRAVKNQKPSSISTPQQAPSKKAKKH